MGGFFRFQVTLKDLLDASDIGLSAGFVSIRHSARAASN